MKNTITILLLFLVSVVSAQNYQSALPKGGKLINFGTSNLLPFYFAFDYGWYGEISVGFEYIAMEVENNGYISSTDNLQGLTAMFNYHFNKLFYISETWDIYSGLNLSYYWDDNSFTDNVYGLGAQVGCRYYFYKGIGINVEGIARMTNISGKLGISLRF